MNLVNRVGWNKIPVSEETSSTTNNGTERSNAKVTMYRYEPVQKITQQPTS